MKIKLLILFFVCLKLNLYSQELNYYFKLAKEYSKKGDFVCAEITLLEGISKDSSDYSVFTNLAFAQKKLGKSKDALKSINKALNIEPNCVKCLINRAAIFREIGEISNAISDYTKALEIEPNYEELLLTRAFVYDEYGYYIESTNDLERLLTINPKHKSARSQFPVMKLKIGKHQEALDYYKLLVSEFPDSAVFWNNLADVEMIMAKYEIAIEHIDQCLKIDSKYPVGYLTKGEILLKMGYIEEACFNFKKALSNGINLKKVESYLNNCK